ncbi:hypothetical protein [Desulfocurvus sp. DL9XJH121]
MSAEQVAEVSRRSGEALMRWNIEMDKTLLRRDPVTTNWGEMLRGKRLSDDIGLPDYGDPHPTPGANKVPEIIKGFLLQSRI